MAMKLVDADVLDAGLTRVADKVREKAGTTEMLAFPDGYESALDSIESADSALAEVESLKSSGYTNYSSFFSNNHQLTNQIPTGIIRHISNGTDFTSMFYNCGALVTIPVLDTINGQNFNYMFCECRYLQTIEGINITNATSIKDMFYSCYQLANITFNGYIKLTGINLSYGGKLTHDSLMSTINALYDHATAGTSGTFTLTLGSTNLAKLTDTEKAIATQRGWTLT